MKFGIVVFPGSNCDWDCHHVITNVLKRKASFIWHKETRLPKVDCIILPGGFSYGDYLRTGAIARFSPVMKEVAKFAEKGGLVIGICNGFQILTETGLLPGVLMRNAGLKFICETVSLRVENTNTRFTKAYAPPSPFTWHRGLRAPLPLRERGLESTETTTGEGGGVVRMPIAHGEGNYFADDETLKRLEGEGRVLFRYHPANPNGSRNDIAGIMNQKGNVLGLMPHPERCSEGIMGGEDGLKLWRSLVETEPRS